MVAYGIGGPVLLLTSKDAPQALAKSPQLNMIVTLFVLGVGLQIVLALINKWAAWHMYRGAYALYQSEQSDPDGDDHHSTRTYKFWRCINKQSWIDFLVDVAALVSFSNATWTALRILLSTTSGS